MDNRTKIIATIGPASEQKPALKKMIEAGLDVCRLNFSHGSYNQFRGIIRNIRDLSKETGARLAVMQDLQGPKIRLGELPEKGISVSAGETIVFVCKIATQGAKHDSQIKKLQVQYAGLGRDTHPGDALLIDDGLIEVKILNINAAKTELTCRVVVGGTLKSHKGINAPQASISAHPLTEKDKRDLAFGLSQGVDYVALSFVKEAKNILELRRLIRLHKGHAKIIAKIERHEAVENMEEIIQAADAVMVARGDLGVEVPAAQVPLIQKKIIRLCNMYGKPVIVATQMLNSMVTEPRATRAEISDAANAIFDHADALMLSNETAVGKYPVEAVQTLQRVASAVEHDLQKHRELLSAPRPETMPIVNATCLNATKLAQDIRAKYIVAITRSGYTAQEIAKYRSFIPVIVFTPDRHVACQMSLVWGVKKTFVEYIHLDRPLVQIKKALLAAGLVKKGDEIVVCNAGFGKKEKLITTTML